MAICPYCGEEAPTKDDEVKHMNDKHPEIVAQRMRAAGFVWDDKRGWIDTLADY